MYPILVLALATWLVSLMDGLTSQINDLKQLYLSRTRQLSITQLAKNIEQYSKENAAFPTTVGNTASTTDLSNTAGFEHTRSLLNNWQNYSITASNIDDGYWLYQRLVLFSNDPTGGLTTAQYLSSANNACKGNGGTSGSDFSFSGDSSWCGKKSSLWFRRESREDYNLQILKQNIRQNRLLQKMAQYYNTNASFPDKDSSNTPLVINSSTGLTALVNYTGTAKACTGQFNLLGVPIDCSDMFDIWGQKISYQFISSKHIILVSETPIYNHDGNRIVIGTEYDYSLI